jgi:hydroxyacid-oxoacid transhydrogenase
VTEYVTETVFTWGGPALKFGIGATDEIAHDVAGLGADSALIITDPGVAATGIPDRVRGRLVEAGIKADVYDGVHVEPTDESLAAAAAYAREGEWDGFVGVGGGSALDTAKAVNLLTTSGGEVLDYVNPPIGAGRAPSKPLKPLVAVPTTAGTGSESTPVCVMDILSLRVKSGISHSRLRPSLAIVDPLNTLTVPPAVTTAAGVDVLTHALESYTSRRYDARPRKAAAERVAYCGANPVSDLWCERALELLARSFRRAVHNGSDLEARSDMMLAATFAGLGFGNAGVHIPHACGYPIAGRVEGYVPSGGYPDHAMVPHGQSVGVTAPATFRWTFAADPPRHLRAAELLGAEVSGVQGAAAADVLPRTLIELFSDVNMPDGVSAFGYGERDVDALVEGAMKQQRLLVGAPREVTPEAVANIFIESMTLYG